MTRVADNRLRLSREQVAAAALELVDRHGLEALSMRRLAEELGVGTMTLYGYFRSKDELLDAVMDAAATGTPAVPREGSWREQARALAISWRANLERHPSIVQVRLQRPLLRATQFRITEQAIAILRAAGFGKADAAHGFRVLFTYAFGSVAFDRPGPEGLAEVRSAMAALPPEEYPMVTSMVHEAVETLSGAEQFEFGLDLILDGLEARLRR